MKTQILLLVAVISILSIGLCYYYSPFFTPNSSPTSKSSQYSIQVSIVITKDFGKKIIQETTVRLPSEISVLEVLKNITQIETSYGGKFITSINGIKSTYPKTPYDWFFYVNGYLAKEGAADYLINDKDLIHWDFHSWELHQYQSAIMGDYPSYFVNGYAGIKSPTVLVFENDFRADAGKIQRQFQENYHLTVNLKPIEKLTDEEKSTSNIIIIAQSENPLVSELNNLQEKIGFFTVFEDHMLIELTYDNTPYRRWEKAGTIQISQNIWNPKGNLACENVILLISGTDKSSISQSVDILTQDFSEYQYSFGLIITEHEIFNLPHQHSK